MKTLRLLGIALAVAATAAGCGASSCPPGCAKECCEGKAKAPCPPGCAKPCCAGKTR